MKKFMSIVLTGAIALSAGAYYIAPAQQTSLTANAEKYEMLEYGVWEGTVEITDCLDVAKGEIVVPESIDGMRVTVIDYDAFNSKKYITSVVLPDTIKEIRGGAFYASSVETVSIQEGVEYIGQYAFHKAPNLKSIKIPDSVKELGEGVFAEDPYLESAVIGKGLKVLPEHTFGDCPVLKSITVPKNIETIESNAFVACTSLKSITIENPYCDIYNDPNTISETATIYGYEDSTAQFYAEIYGRKFVNIDAQTTTTTTKATTTTTTKATTTTAKPTTTTTAKPTTTTTTEATKTVKGDSNEDGKVTIADAVAILQYLANADEYALSEQGMKNADVIGNGNGVNTNDALMIQKWDAGLIDSLE